MFIGFPQLPAKQRTGDFDKPGFQPLGFVRSYRAGRVEGAAEPIRGAATAKGLHV